MEFVSDSVEWTAAISRIQQIILCDAQTSGGLLIAIPEKFTSELIARLHKSGVSDAAIIGKVCKKGEGKIVVK